jgi:predicted DNA-binding protein with PD1-like motif
LPRRLCHARHQSPRRTHHDGLVPARDDIIAELRDLCAREGIDAALITSGIGSFDICKLHTITNTGLPPEEHYFTLEGPIEVGSLLGSVAGGEPHIHVVVHDVAKDQVHVGHLEPGSRCCFRCELGLTVLEGVKTARVKDPETQLVDIVAVED